MSESKQAVTSKYDVGNGRMMTIAEIAELTSISRQNIRKRILGGVTGAALLEPAHDRATQKGGKWDWVWERWRKAEAHGLTEAQKLVKGKWVFYLGEQRPVLPSGEMATNSPEGKFIGYADYSYEEEEVE